MPVFISYSHDDTVFATEMASQLVAHRKHVWIDKWELRVGDSLMERIQSALQDASALLFVLSRSSVASQWCKKELSAGLMRELEERRVVVLPILLEDCDIPLFLRDKLYADFRSDFDEGLRSVLEAIACVTSDTQGRLQTTDVNVDWSIDWETEDGSFIMILTMVEHIEGQPCCVLTEVKLTANEIATERYARFEEAGLDWIERGSMIELLAHAASECDVRLLLQDTKAAHREFGAGDPKLGVLFDVEVAGRRLGEDRGGDMIVDVAGQLRGIRDANRQSSRTTTPAELEEIRVIQHEIEAERNTSAS